MSGVYSMSGPTYSPLSSLDLLDSALSQPLSLTSTLYEEGKGGALESFGLGTVLRQSQVPLPAPSEQAPYGFDPEGLPVPQGISPQDYLQGNWVTPDMIAKKRQEMGALTEDQYKQSPSYRKDIPYDPGMTETRAAALAAMDDARKVREFYAQKRPLAAFLGSMAGQALDPINYVPVAGPLVKGAAVARFGRIGGEALTAGLDAAANTALFGVGTANVRAQFGDDVSWQGLISQIATAGLIGSAFGTVAGAIGRRMDARVAEAEQRLATLQTTQEARIALNEGIDALVNGEDIKLSPNATDPMARVVGDIQQRSIPVDAGPKTFSVGGKEYNSARELNVELERMLQEQEKREALLSDPAALRSYAADKGISEEEMKALLLDNKRNAAPIVEELKGIASSEEFKSAQASERSRASGIKFNDISGVNHESLPDVLSPEAPRADERPTILNDSSLNRTASWVIRDKETKAPVMETFNPSTVERLNTDKYEAVPIEQYLGELNQRTKAQPTVDTTVATPEPRSEGIKQAEASVAKPENTKALAAQYSVDPNTGAFPEEAEVAQLAVEGRMTQEDATMLAQAEADYQTGSAYAEALKSVVGCIL